MNKFETIDFTGLGLGDCVAGMLVLAHLCEFDLDLELPYCTVIVPKALVGVGSALFQTYGLKIRNCLEAGTSLASRRRLILRPPSSVKEITTEMTGSRTHLNWAEFCELESSWTELWSTWSAARKLRFRLLQAIQYGFASPKTGGPVYIGFRLLFPLIRQSKFTLTAHVFHSKRTFSSIRRNVNAYISANSGGTCQTRGRNYRKLIFPGSESFGAMPISVCMKLQEKFGDSVAFVLHESDISLPHARRVLRQLIVVSTVEETLCLISNNSTISVDSFVSHLIQMTNDDAVILFGRELKERFVHPGAHPRILEAFPECAPCIHRSKRMHALCPANRSECIAFDSLYTMLIDDMCRGLP